MSPPLPPANVHYTREWPWEKTAALFHRACGPALSQRSVESPSVLVFAPLVSLNVWLIPMDGFVGAHTNLV